MVIVNVLEAKTTLSQLLAKVEAGEDVMIARNGNPVARLTHADHTVRQAGLLAAEPDWQGYDPAIWAPMTDEELVEAGWPV